MRLLLMFVNAVFVLVLGKLRWRKKKSIDDDDEDNDDDDIVDDVMTR